MPAERAEAADLVANAGLSYRWDPGFVLRVAGDAEAQVDALFGHNTDEVVAFKTLREVAAALVSSPVVAEETLAQLADATGVVITAEPPGAVNRVLWSTVGSLARQLLDVLDDGSPPEDVTAAATVLDAVLARS
ncbi:MAG: hypothetical protein ACYDH6_24000 [Acidimicrobiales bacterium]